MKTLLAKYNSAFRRFKPVYWLFNVLNLSRLRKNSVHYKTYGINKPVWVSLSHKDIKIHSEDVPWLDKSGWESEFESRFSSYSMNEKLKPQLRSWPEKGYLVLESFYDNQRIDDVLFEINYLCSENKIAFDFRKRVTDGHLKATKLNALLNDKELLKIFNFLLGRNVNLFQSLYFNHGTEQKAHSDFYHMSTEPYGCIIAAWIALEDISNDSGPLLYYPGSHRLPVLMNEHFNSGNGKFTISKDIYRNYETEVGDSIRKNILKPESFLAKKGDILIWHGNLLHGGNPIQNPESTRKSVVGHYLAENALCYHEITQRPTIH